MKKLVLAVLLPSSVVVFSALGLWTLERGALPGFRPEAVPVTVQEISKEHRGVRIQGTANYGAKLKQTAPDGETVWWIYPLMETGQTHEREIKVLVRTTVPPDPILGFEDRTIEGFARPPGRLLPQSARDALRQRDYTLSPDVMLVEEWAD